MRSNYAFDIAEALEKYSKEYECSIFEAAQDMDHPVSVEVYRKAFYLLDEPISEENLRKIGDSEERVEKFWKEEGFYE